MCSSSYMKQGPALFKLISLIFAHAHWFQVSGCWCRINLLYEELTITKWWRIFTSGKHLSNFVVIVCHGPKTVHTYWERSLTRHRRIELTSTVQHRHLSCQHGFPDWWSVVNRGSERFRYLILNAARRHTW